MLAFTIFACFFASALAQSLTLAAFPSAATVSYFNALFVVTSSSGNPEVECKITCPNGAVSSLLYQMTNFPAQNIIPVPAPVYTGACVASVTATGYTPATQPINVQNYTQCQSFTLTTTRNFGTTTNATYSASYTKSGPIGLIEVTRYTVSSPSLTRAQYRGMVSTAFDSAIFYQSSCTGYNPINMAFSDSGTVSLSDCTNYNNNPASKFAPFTPFSTLYGEQAQGTFLFTTYKIPDVAGTGSVSNFQGRICLAPNYIVVETVTPTFVPSASLNFTAYLGLMQSMSASAKATLACPSFGTEQTTFTITSTPQQFNINTPAAPLGTSCTLTIVGNPEADSYSAPENVKLTAAAAIPLLLTVFSSTSASAGDSISFTVYTPLNPSISSPVTMEFYCNNVLVGSSDVVTTSSPQSFTIPADAMGTCQFKGVSNSVSFEDTNSVDFIIYQQLSFDSSLIGWISGSTVPIRINSPNQQPQQVTLNTACSIGSFSGSVSTSLNAIYSIDPSVNGVGCLLTTTNVPQYYLPIPATYVNIALGQAQQKQIIQLLNPASFIGALTVEQKRSKLLKRQQLKKLLRRRRK